MEDEKYNPHARAKQNTITQAELNPLSRVDHVIGVISGKGGVGKSLISSLIAVALNRLGRSVAILDADITGPSIPKSFGITQKAYGEHDVIIPAYSLGQIQIMSANLLLESEDDPILWRGPLIGDLVKQFYTDVYWRDVEYMVIDMPPGTGDVALTTFQSIPVTGIIIVTTPQDLVANIVQKAIKMAQQMQIKVLGLVENMSYVECPDCGKRINIYGNSHAEETAKKFAIPFLGQLPIQPELSRLVDAGEIEKADTSRLTKVIETILENE